MERYTMRRAVRENATLPLLHTHTAKKKKKERNVEGISCEMAAARFSTRLAERGESVRCITAQVSYSPRRCNQNLITVFGEGDVGH